MTTYQQITQHVRNLVRSEIIQTFPNAKRVIGMDVHYFPGGEVIRHNPEGEPKPLKFAGNSYVAIYVGNLQVVLNDGSKQGVTLEAVRKAFDNVKWNHMPNNIITVEGKEHQLLDPEVTTGGRIDIGFAHIRIPKKPETTDASPKPVFPPKPV